MTMTDDARRLQDIEDAGDGPDTYSSAPRKGGPVEYDRVYRFTGRYAHLRPYDSRFVLCWQHYSCCIEKDRCCKACGILPRSDPRNEAAIDTALNENLCCCPHEDDPDAWLGTGCQPEFDKAKRMPACPRCFILSQQVYPDSRLGTAHGAEMT